MEVQCRVEAAPSFSAGRNWLELPYTLLELREVLIARLRNWAVATIHRQPAIGITGDEPPPYTMWNLENFAINGEQHDMTTSRRPNTCKTQQLRRVTQVFLYFTLCSLWWSVDFLASWLEGSWRPCCKFGVSTTRGNIGDGYTLQYKSSPIFMKTTQFISQVKCWKERLRGIVFDRTAIPFSERVSNCTNTLYFGELTKFCPFSDFFLPESVHSGWWSACRERSRCGRCTRRSHPATVHCLAM